MSLIRIEDLPLDSELDHAVAKRTFGGNQTGRLSQSDYDYRSPTQDSGQAQQSGRVSSDLDFFKFSVNAGQ